ncbi:hypothetical protein BH10PSE9_BH10PSE9_17100 [soil metagenome]
MSLKTQSVIVQEVSDAAGTAVEGVFRNGKLISAIAVARQILEDHPDCNMPVETLADRIGRMAVARGVAVEFDASISMADRAKLPRSGTSRR